MSTEHTPHPIIQIDLPEPVGDDKSSAAARGLQWIAGMLVMANDHGKEQPEAFAERMMAKMMALPQAKLVQLVDDMEVLAASVSRAKATLQGGALLHRIQDMRNTLLDSMEEGQDEDPTDDDGPADDENFLPKLA
jgi:hypothetical protein